MLARPSWSSTLLGALVVYMWVAPLTPLQARAQSELARAVRLAERAEPEASLDAFERALASGALNRAELRLLLSERARVYAALRREAELARDLDALALFAPDHDFGHGASPSLKKAWEQRIADKTGPLQIWPSCEPLAVGARVHVQLSSAVDSSLGRVVITVEEPGRGWVRHEASEVDLHATASPTRYYVELVGAGEVALANAGTEQAPLRCTIADEPHEKPRERHKALWWVGGAAGAAALATTAVWVLIGGRSSSSDSTGVSAPEVRWE